MTFLVYKFYPLFERLLLTALNMKTDLIVECLKVRIILLFSIYRQWPGKNSLILMTLENLLRMGYFCASKYLRSFAKMLLLYPFSFASIQWPMQIPKDHYKPHGHLKTFQYDCCWIIFKCTWYVYNVILYKWRTSTLKREITIFNIFCFNPGESMILIWPKLVYCWELFLRWAMWPMGFLL